MKTISKNKIDKEFDKHKIPLIIYDSNITSPITINKYSQSLDILPTILNMFGVDFDSRLLMGRDIMSNSKSLVIFSDRSFITDKIKYNNVSEKITYLTKNKNIDKNYINNIKDEIYKKFRYSRLILENNYYSYLH